jgi:hypothetical protein
MCSFWRRSFAAFRNWALENGYEPRNGLTLDRIDNDGKYAPWNCRWATRTQQARNRRYSHLLTLADETKCLAEWAEDPRCEVPYRTLCHRIHEGWSAEDAMSIGLTSYSDDRLQESEQNLQP